jgi:hypothetical protein
MLLFITRIRPENKMARRPARAQHVPRARPRSGLKMKTARRPAHAQRAPCARPHRGPGLGKLRPTWAMTRSVKREPSICIQRPHVDSGRTKRRQCPRANPRVHSRFLTPRHAPQLASRQHRHGFSHRCTRPPMGGRAAVERLLCRALPAHRSERATALVGR